MRELKLTIFLITIAAIAACSQSAVNNPGNSTANTVASNSAPANKAPAPPAANDDSAAGGKLYSSTCAKCHKDDGTGGKITVDGKTLNPDNLASAKLAAKSDQKLTEYISDGAPDDGMPAFKDKLKPEEIKQIITFIRSDIQKNTPKPPANK